MKSLHTLALVLPLLLLGACAARDSSTSDEAAKQATKYAAPLVGSAWECRPEVGVIKVSFLDGWLASEVDDTIYWTRVEYDVSGQRVTRFQNLSNVDGPVRIERIADRLEIAGDGESVVCEQMIEPFVTEADAPTELLWETQRAFEVGDVWNGEYECAQGFTDARLRVDRVAEGSVKATFYFSHTPTNVSGSFVLRGTFNPWEDTIVWTAGDWIDQPADYVTIDFIGSISPDRTMMRGDVVGPYCTGFELRR